MRSKIGRGLREEEEEEEEERERKRRGEEEERKIKRWLPFLSMGTPQRGHGLVLDLMNCSLACTHRRFSALTFR